MAHLEEYQRALRALKEVCRVDRTLRRQYGLAEREEFWPRHFKTGDQSWAQRVYEDLVWAVILLARSTWVDQCVAMLSVEYVRNQLRWNVRPGDADSSVWRTFLELTEAVSWDYDWRADSFAPLDLVLESDLSEPHIMLFKLSV
jgi:hypothetical protein